MLNVEQLKKALATQNVVFLDEISSTNTLAKQLAQQGAAEGTIVIASRQTAGRGRLGRNFFSPQGGIYMSLILRPDFPPESSVLITTAAAVAAAQTIESSSNKKCFIKWVNDIFIDGKKVCGILTEGAISTQNDRLDYAILGIGINLTAPRRGYPSDIKNIAGAVFGRALTSAQKTAVIADFYKRFFNLYGDIQSRCFLEEYRNRCFLIGKEIEYVKEGALHTATVLDIDDNARLVVDEGAKTVTLGAGEVSVKLKL